MKRYTYNNFYESICKDINGEYVLYEDVEELIEKLRKHNYLKISLSLKELLEEME